MGLAHLHLSTLEPELRMIIYALVGVHVLALVRTASCLFFCPATFCLLRALRALLFVAT